MAKAFLPEFVQGYLTELEKGKEEKHYQLVDSF
jgi:hypothetical protein